MAKDHSRVCFDDKMHAVYNESTFINRDIRDITMLTVICVITAADETCESRDSNLKIHGGFEKLDSHI